MNTIRNNPKPTDINSLLKFYKSISIIAIISLVAVTGTFAYLYTTEIKAQSKRAYFVTPNMVYEGDMQNTELINYYRAKDHVRKFISLVFAHEEKNFTSRIEAGLHLINKEEGRKLYYQIKKAGVLESYQKFNVRNRVSIDSINLDMSTIPVKGKVYFKQILVLPNSESIQPIAFSFRLVPTGFTNENNSAGLEIQDLQSIKYELPSDNVTEPSTMAVPNTIDE